MPKIFPIVVRKTTVVGGGITDAFKITIVVPEANATPGDTTTQALTASYADANAAATEAATATIRLPADANAAPTDVRDSFVRYWPSASSDNDSSRTTPANASGQNDAVFATVKTNLATGDLTNPVVLTSTTFGVPTTGAPTSKKLRVWFDVGARATTLDTINLFYNIGAGDVAIYTHAGTAAVNHDTGDFTFDVSALTMAQLASVSLKASYTASVVASPETSIRVDAWAIEIEGTV